jgi:hypothetical protein
LRALLISASQTAEVQLHAELKKPMAQWALHEEADNYRAYISVLTASDLAGIEPLPFRRVLETQESMRLWNQLKQVWSIGGGYWFPLKEGAAPSSVIAFHVDYFEKMGGVRLLREALTRRGISRVYQLQEFVPPEPEYEIDLSILEPAYGSGGEQYSTSEPMDWVVYASHESSITIAGDWLTEIFKEKWPEWNRRTYEGPFSTENLRGLGRRNKGSG